MYIMPKSKHFSAIISVVTDKDTEDRNTDGYIKRRTGLTDRHRDRETDEQMHIQAQTCTHTTIPGWKGARDRAIMSVGFRVISPTFLMHLHVSHISPLLW